MFMATLRQMAISTAAVAAASAPQGAAAASLLGGIGQLHLQDTAFSGSLGAEK